MHSLPSLQSTPPALSASPVPIRTRNPFLFNAAAISIARVARCKLIWCGVDGVARVGAQRRARVPRAAAVLAGGRRQRARPLGRAREQPLLARHRAGRAALLRGARRRRPALCATLLLPALVRCASAALEVLII